MWRIDHVSSTIYHRPVVDKCWSSIDKSARNRKERGAVAPIQDTGSRKVPVEPAAEVHVRKARTFQEGRDAGPEPKEAKVVQDDNLRCLFLQIRTRRGGGSFFGRPACLPFFSCQILQNILYQNFSWKNLKISGNTRTKSSDNYLRFPQFWQNSFRIAATNMRFELGS